MGTRTQPLSTAALHPVIVTAEEILRFSGKRPPLPLYRLEQVEDQGDQYELAMAFDDDGDDDAGEVNPFYGIPFGVAMLMVRDPDGAPAGFITFRHELRETAPGADGRRRAQYAFKIFVFMVREDLRGQGYGSALAVGALSAIRDALEAISACCDEAGAGRPVVSLRFVGEGKSEGGLQLLDRVARNVGILSGEVHRDRGLAFGDIAAEIL